MVPGLRSRDRWRFIGAWSWEFATSPETSARQARYVSEIRAPSLFVAGGFKAQYDRPVLNLPHHVPVAATCLANAEPADRPLRVLALEDGRSSHERKNILSCVQIFQDALPAPFPAELVIKCRNLDIAPAYLEALRGVVRGDARIRLVHATLGHAELARLLDQCGILLSPHRSEGFRVHLAEAMARGKCVIATGWCGTWNSCPGTALSCFPERSRHWMTRPAPILACPERSGQNRISRPARRRSPILPETRRGAGRSAPQRKRRSRSGSPPGPAGWRSAEQRGQSRAALPQARPAAPHKTPSETRPRGPEPDMLRWK